MGDDTSAGRWFGLPTTLALAALPLAGYAISFAYESGYIAWFGVPAWAIRIDLTQALVAAASMGAAVTFIHAALLLLPSRPWVYLLYLAWLPLCAITVAVLVALATDWHWGRHLITPIIVIVVVGTLGMFGFYDGVIRPLRIYRELPSVWDRWIRHSKKNVTTRARDMVDAVIDADATGGRRAIYLAIMGLWLLLALASGYGSFQASKVRWLWLSTSQPTCAAVRRYGDEFLCVTVDTAKLSLQHQFRLVPVSSSGERWTRFLARNAIDNGDPGVRKLLFSPDSQHAAKSGP